MCLASHTGAIQGLFCRREASIQQYSSDSLLTFTVVDAVFYLPDCCSPCRPIHLLPLTSLHAVTQQIIDHTHARCSGSNDSGHTCTAARVNTTNLLTPDCCSPCRTINLPPLTSLHADTQAPSPHTKAPDSCASAE